MLVGFKAGGNRGLYMSLFGGFKNIALLATMKGEISLGGDALDGRNPAPPKKPWNDNFLQLPANNGFERFQSGSGFRPSAVS